MSKYLSKEQECHNLGLSDPWIYKDIEDVRKWWRFKMEWNGNKGYGYIMSLSRLSK